MDLFEKVVEMATDLNPKAQIIVRNDVNGNWFLHYFIIENGHKTLYQKYTNDLTKALKEIKGMIEALKQGAISFNKDIKSIKINDGEE